MQDPIFEEYHIDKTEFWKEVNALPAQYAKEGIRVNGDTIYLNQFIKETRKGTFKGLNNEKLRGLWSKTEVLSRCSRYFQESQSGCGK